MTTVAPDEIARPAGPPPCECVHPMPWGDEPCDDPAAFEIDDGARSLLLCVECFEAWREVDQRRFGEVRFTTREW